MVADRVRLRETFETAAKLYDAARPRYPEELFDALIETAGLQAGDHLLEVGCATGVATLPLAQRGFDLTCVELGHEPSPATLRCSRGSEANSTRRSEGGWPVARTALCAEAGEQSFT